MAAELTLQYQRGSLGVVTPARRDAARHLRVWACLLAVFAILLAWFLVNRIVIEHVVHSRWDPDPDLGFVWRRHDTWTYHWNRLPIVAVAAMAPVAIATVYWLVARVLLKDHRRLWVWLALALAMLHTLVGLLLLLCGFIFASSNLTVGWPTFQTIPADLAGILAVATVPGMLYVSMRLMDLLGQNRKLGMPSADPAPIPPVDPEQLKGAALAALGHGFDNVDESETESIDDPPAVSPPPLPNV